MSEYIRACTFSDEIVMPEDDAMIRSAISTNGIIAGVIPTDPVINDNGAWKFKLSTGWLILAGRLLQVTAPDGVFFNIETNKNYAFLIAHMNKNNVASARPWIDVMYSDSGDCPNLNKGYINTGSSDYSENELYEDVLLAARKTNGNWVCYYQLKQAQSSTRKAMLLLEPGDWHLSGTEYIATKSVSWVHPDDDILVTYGPSYRKAFMDNGIYGYSNGFGTIEMRASSVPSSSVYAAVFCLGSNTWGHTTFNP